MNLAATTLQTNVGQLIGTLQYMSPEQCEADPTEIDARADVYALGVVLYGLLCNELPYEIRRLSIPEAVRVIREQEPTRLSTIERRFRGDVENIIGPVMSPRGSMARSTRTGISSDRALS